MKRMMIAGGGLGFGLGTACGVLTEGSSWSGILFRASVGALVTGLLWRWLGGVMLQCYAEAQQAAEARAAQNRSGTPPTPAPAKTGPTAVTRS